MLHGHDRILRVLSPKPVDLSTRPQPPRLETPVPWVSGGVLRCRAGARVSPPLPEGEEIGAEMASRTGDTRPCAVCALTLIEKQR